MDPHQRKQASTFGQVFTRLIPTTDPELRDKLAGPRRVEKIPLPPNVKAGQRTTVDVPLKRHQQDELYNMFGGLRIRRINPMWQQLFIARARENKVARKLKGKE
jgi:hypothetical protein